MQEVCVLGAMAEGATGLCEGPGPGEAGAPCPPPRPHYINGRNKVGGSTGRVSRPHSLWTIQMLNVQAEVDTSV